MRMRYGDVRALDQKRQALILMESAGCDTTQPSGPKEWSKLQQALAPDYRLKIFQFKINTRRLQLELLYKGWGNGQCINVLFDYIWTLRRHTLIAWRHRYSKLLRLL
jgi:hypothetical protein